MIDVLIPKKSFNAVYLPLLECEDRYLVLYGGAGSGKSYFAVERFVYRMLKGDVRLLAVRQTAKSNRDSTFALFKQVISNWGLGDLFKINEGDMRIKCLATSSQVIFAGLDDVEKLKSITFDSGVLNSLWIEEASEISEADFNQLDIRLRGGKSNKQIVISFNPTYVNHWLKKRFFDRKVPNATVLHTTYKDNTFLDRDYGALLESYRDTDPYCYDVYCLGNWGVTGQTVFDARRLQERLTHLEKPVKTGEFEYAYDGLFLSSVRFSEREDGFIRIFEMPKKGTPYVIGADTAGEGSDRFVAQVLDNVTGKQVAVLRHTFDEDLFARQIYCLGQFYNFALVGIEANFSTYPIRELQRLGYPLQYTRITEDSYTFKPKESFGFRTTAVTRPVILAELVRVVRENSDTLNCPVTIDEMLTFVRNESGRAEAMSGCHDDCVMALAIAHYIRPQQSMTALKNGSADGVKWEADMLEDYANADEEGKRKLELKWGKPRG